MVRSTIRDDCVMIALSILNLFRGQPETVTELPYNFLRTAFQTTTPGILTPDIKNPYTAASEVVREVFARFSIDGIYSTDEIRRYRVNQSGAAAIFTEAKTVTGKGSKTALFMLTQASSPRPSKTPYLETTDTVPVFVFAGQYRNIEGKSGFVCTSIHHKTADIPVDALMSDAKKNTVSIKKDQQQVTKGLAFGEQCFQQFLRGERLRPKEAQKAVDLIPAEELQSYYEQMRHPTRSDGILQMAARLPL